MVLTADINLPSGSQRGAYHYVFGDENLATFVDMAGTNNTYTHSTGSLSGVKMEFTDGSSATTDNAKVKLRITIPSATFKALNISKFKLAVYDQAKTASAAKELSAKTAEPKVANLPPLYLHVSDVAAAGAATEGAYTRIHPGSPLPDTIKGVDLNGEFYLRFTCDDPNVNKAWKSNCFMQPTAMPEGLTVNDAQVRVYKDGSVAGSDKWVNKVKNNAKELYWGIIPWSNGCVSYTDTIVVVPTRTFDAPSLSLQHIDCATPSTPMGFKMTAQAPAGITIDHWEWVIRLEVCMVEGSTVMIGSSATPAVEDPQSPTNIASVDAWFGGGVKMESGQQRNYAYDYGQVLGSAYPVDYSVNYTLKVSSVAENPTGSELSLNGACNSGVFPGCSEIQNTMWNWGVSIGSAWMPPYDADLAPGARAAKDVCYGSGYSSGNGSGIDAKGFAPLYWRGTYKRAYARYITTDGDKSAWANILTPEVENPNNTVKGFLSTYAYWSGDNAIDMGSDFSITWTKANPGPDFDFTPRLTDTTLETAGEPIQFYLTTNVPFVGGQMGQSWFTTVGEFLWQVSDDDGLTWNTWAITPIGTSLTGEFITFGSALQWQGKDETLSIVPAPSLRNPTKKEKYRIVYNANCNRDETDEASNYSRELTVKLASNVKEGEIVAWVDGTGIKDKYDPMCEEQVDLVLQNYEPGATLQWLERDDQSSTWRNISGATSATYTYVPPTLAQVLNTPVYASGYKHFFKVEVSVGADVVETAEYEVDKYYVVKPYQKVMNPKAITSGICMGDELVLAFDSDKGNNDLCTHTLYQATATDPNTFTATSDVANYYTGIGYFYGKTNQAINNYRYYIEYEHQGCKAQSDTLQYKVVDKPTAGTISPSEFCPGKQTTLSYNGTNLGNQFVWKYQGTGALVDIATTTSTTTTVTIPESAVPSNKVIGIMLIPSNKRTAPNVNGTGTDETVCYIGVNESAAASIIGHAMTVGENCNFILTPSVADFCENAIPDSLVLKMDGPQTADNATPGDGFTLKYRQYGSNAAYTTVPSTYYRVGSKAADNTYDSLIIYPIFFTATNGFTARNAPVEFIVTVKLNGTNQPDPTPAVVGVAAAPKFSGKSLTVSEVCAGENLVFTAGITAKELTTNLTPTYTWYYTGSANDTAYGPYSAVAGQTNHTVATNKLTIQTDANNANNTTLNGRFYGVVASATSAGGCTAYDTTPFIQPVINPLPDTGKFVKSFAAGDISVTTPSTTKTVTLYSCTGTSVTLKAVTDETLKNGTLKHTDYTYEWTLNGAAVTAATGTVTSTPNTGSQCVIPVSAATAGTKVYKLKITASALKKNGTDYGCPRSVELTFNVIYSACDPDKLTDGTSTAYGKTKAYMVCEEDLTWQKVKVVPSNVPASSPAPVTSVKLYHATVKTGPYTELTFNDGAATDYMFNPKAASAPAAVKTTGSHYYYAKVERTGFSPTYTDTAEYVIGNMPSITNAAGAGVYLTADNSVINTATTTTLAVCAGTPVYMKVRGLPDSDPNGTVADASVGYKWFQSTTAITSPVSPEPASGSLTGNTDTYSIMGAGRANAADAGYYYVYRHYNRDTKTQNTTPEAKQTCKGHFAAPNVAQLTVNAMPAKPSAMQSDTKNVCDGEQITFKGKVTAPASPEANTTYTYRWYRHDGSGHTDLNVTGTLNGQMETADLTVTADAAGATTVKTYTYKLFVKAETTAGCVDSTSSPYLSGITVNITPRAKFTAPTVPDSVKVCEKSAASLSFTAPTVGSNYKLTYQWYKCASATGAQAPATDTKISGATGTTYNIGSATVADHDAYYYAGITATPTSGTTTCDTTVYTKSVKLQVWANPVFGTSHSVTTAGVAGSYAATICTNDETTIVFTPGTAAGYAINPNTGNSNTDGYTWTSTFKGVDKVCGSASADYRTYTISNQYTKEAGEVVVSLRLRYKSVPGGCDGDTTLKFTVTISACSGDLLVNGRNNEPADKTHPLTVCVNEPENTWPTLKVNCQNMASKEVTKIEIWHATAKDGTYTKVATQNVTGGLLTPTYEFDITTANASYGLKATGSHYYYAAVTRNDGTGKDKYTDTVEYVVGAMPEPSVVNGASIMVSTEATQAAALAANATNTLTLCAGPQTYLYLKNMPTPPEGTTHTKYEWYKGTSASVPAVPPTSGVTAVGGNADNVSLGATTATVTTTDYYYSYHRYSRNTVINSTSANKACDTVYPIAQAGVRIVNPMPSKPTSISLADFKVCAGETFDLTPTVTPAAPATTTPTTTWGYRWFKDGLDNTNIVYPTDKSQMATSASWTGISAVNGTTSNVVNSYKLKVYATNGLCNDTVKFDGVTVTVNPKPAATTPALKAYTGTGYTTESADGKVCEDATIQIKTTANINYTSGGIDGAPVWFKLKAGETCSDLSPAKGTAVSGGNYAAGGTAAAPTLTITANDNSVSGTYYLMLPIKRDDCKDTVYSSACVDIEFVPQPEVTIKSSSALTFNLCAEAGKSATMSVTLDDATMSEITAGTSEVTYQWYKGSAKIDGATAASYTETLGANPATGTTTYYVEIKKKTKGTVCETTLLSKDATADGGLGATFSIKVQDCDKDKVEDGRDNEEYTKVKPFMVCDGDPAAAWPIVKIDAQDMAGDNITSIVLKYRYGTSGEFVNATSSTPNATTATLTFNPTSQTITGQDVKKAGSHYYFALVTRADGSVKSTDTVEYMIGKRPELGVVNGTLPNDASVVVSLEDHAAGAVTGEKDSLVICPKGNPDTWLYLLNEPSGTTLTGENTTRTAYAWYKGTATTNVNVPVTPAGTKIGGNDGKVALGPASNDGTAPTVDYYYAYISYSRKNTAVSNVAFTKTCDTTYRVGKAGVRIVNPMPDLPTTISCSVLPLCDGATFNLQPTLSPATSANGATWTYRWYKMASATADRPDANIFYPADKTKEGSSKDTTGIVAELSAANKTSGTTEYYYLTVYSANAYCRDTFAFTNQIPVQIKALPYVTNQPVIKMQKGTDVTTDGRVCAGDQIKLVVNTADLGNTSGTLSYEWYKLRAGATYPADRDPSKDVRVTNNTTAAIAGATTATLTITANDSAAVSGKYYLMIPLTTTGGANACRDTAYSKDIAEVIYVARPVVKVVDTSLMTYTLCPEPGEQATLWVDLDAVTKQQVTDNLATVTYQWYKGSAEMTGETAATLTVTVPATPVPGTTEYYVKITKTMKDYSCPTVLLSKDAYNAAADKNSGMGKTFKVIVKAACGQDGIILPPDQTLLTSATATAICSAEADPGKTFQAKVASDLADASKVSWYYAPVTAGVMGTPVAGPTCNGPISSTTTSCTFSTKANGMTVAGEWRIWADVERTGANMRTTDTITFVVRPNPTLADEASLGLNLFASDGTTPIADWIVCQGTQVQLKLSTAPNDPAFNSYTDVNGETHKDTVTYAWECENCGSGSAYRTTTKVWGPISAALGGTPKPSASGMAGAPAEASYANAMKLDQTYNRRFQRSTKPTYNITCPVMKDGVAYTKTLKDTLYASETPKGSLADSDSKTASTHCTSAIDGSSKVTLVLTPNATTPQTQATQWQYAAKETPAEADWQDWAAADATTPNSLDVALNDSRLTKPAAGEADKKYTFRAKTKNGKCTGVTDLYTLTFMSAPEAGTITVPTDLCAGATTQIKVDAADVKPATATVTFNIYTDAALTNSAVSTPGTANCNGGKASWTGSVNAAAITAPTKYYVRYTVKANTPCTDVNSEVKEVTLYPTPTFSFGPNATQLCLTDDATLDLNFTTGNADEIKLYAFPETKNDAQVTAATPLKTFTAAEISAGKVTVNASDLFADDAKKQNSKTYFYIVAKQTALSGVAAAASCAEVKANTSIATANPVVKPVIGWNAAATEKAIGPVETNERKDIYIKNGTNGLDTSMLSVIKKTDDTDPDWSVVKTESVKANPFSFQAYDVDELYVWAVVKGYNGCPAENSDTITIAVQKSEKYTAERIANVCSNDEIICWIKPGSGAGGIKEDSYTWQYKPHSGGSWTDVPGTATVGDLDSCKLIWANHNLAAGAYDFKMKYKSGSDKDEETIEVAVTVYARPTLSSTDALNLPGATCEGTPFAVKLKDGVTATGTQNLLFCAGDPDADGAVWTSKASTTGTLSYPASALADSGNYRLIVYNATAATVNVCDTIESDVRLLEVNAKPKAGTLTIAPDPQCFGKDVTVTLGGDVSGQIVDYEYHPDHSGTPTGDKPATPGAATAKEWRSVGTPSASYPIEPGTDYVATDGLYPASWTLKNVKYGYSIRAKVTNGVCDAVYAVKAVTIKDTVEIKTHPKNAKPMVDETTGLPTGNVAFNGTAGRANGKYLDGSSFEATTDAITYQWQMAKDGSTWEEISGVASAATANLDLPTTFWEANSIDKDVLSKIRFRLAATDAACSQTVYSNPAKIEPQAELKAGNVNPNNPESTVNCFYYGDTVMLVHDGYNGQGTVEHHWRVGPNPSSVPSASNVKTLDEAGCKYHYGVDNEGNEDRTTIYLVAPANPAGGFAQWWTNNYIYVFVTDDLHPVSDMFDGNGHLKATPDETYYAYPELCFSEKPKWYMPNDTICFGETDTVFDLLADNVTVNASNAPNIARLQFAFKTVKDADWQPLLSFGNGNNVSTATCTATDAEGTKEVTVTMEMDGGKPSGKLTLTAKTPNAYIDSIFDSLMVRTVVRTDYSQKDDTTLYAVLRIDRGIRPLTATGVELRVCEGEQAQFEQTLERFNPSIETDLKWEWKRRATSGDATTDTDPASGTPLSGQTKAGVPAPVKLAINNVKASDSGIWVLKVTTACGKVEEQEFTLKVDLTPEIGSLEVADNQFCSGTQAVELTAVVNNVNSAEITWEQYYRNATDGVWTMIRVWDNTADRVTMTNDPIDGNEYNRKLTLKIDKAYQSDSGQYRIVVKPQTGVSACTYDLYREIRVIIDTTPQIEITQPWSAGQGDPSNVKATVKNPKSADDPECTQVAAGWYVFAPNAADDEAAISIDDYLGSTGAGYSGNLSYTAPNGEGSTLSLASTPLELDGLRAFYMAENCCGVSYSDTVTLSVQGDLEIDVVDGNSPVCEGATVTLTVTANMNLSSGRIWEYRAPGGDWNAVPFGNGAFEGATATETMPATVSTLTITNVPYKMDGYEFRFRANYKGKDYFSKNVYALIVRPVNDLHVVVTATPNPASQTTGFNSTMLNAVVYVGGPLDETGQMPADAEVLDKDKLARYEYSQFDWYQIMPGHPDGVAPYEPNDGYNSGYFQTDNGQLHDETFKLVELSHNTHDSTSYFAVLRHSCFNLSDLPNQTSRDRYEGLHSDTTLLRIYDVLVVEWSAESWWGGPDADTLDFGTTAADLDTMLIPTDRVIGVDLDGEPDGDWDEHHMVSSVYYLRCGDNDDVSLTVELRRGVQSEEEDWVIKTRQWYYRKPLNDEWTEWSDWYAIVPDDLGGTFDDEEEGTVFNMLNGRRELRLLGVSYFMNGWQFKSMAYADYIEERGGYQYADSTPVLTLVVSEPLPSPDELAFLPFEDEGSCEAYNYVFDVNAKHDSYHYDWEIKRPEDADYQVVDSLKNKDVFHYGPATEDEDGTMIRVTVSNYCDTLETEVALRVMTVKITPEEGDLCADGTLELTAEVKNGGDNPTFEWSINGQVIPGATGQTFAWPSDLPAPDENGLYHVQVLVKADPTLPFVNPVACAQRDVHALPSGFKAVADPTEVEMSETTMLDVEGLPERVKNVEWSPSELVPEYRTARTETGPLENSGSQWFYATVTDEYGCSATDSVEVIVASSFMFDSAVTVVVVQPSLPQFDPDGNYETPDTTLVVVSKNDTLRIIACENSIAFVSLCTSGGEPPLRYEWMGITPLNSEELTEYGYSGLVLPDSVFALYLDGEVTSFDVKITEKDGQGLSVYVHGFISYYVTQHVALEAIPHMRHNRYYENQIVFFTAHPNRFSWYNFYNYNVTANEVSGEQHDRKNLFKTDYEYDAGAERQVFVSVADKHGCRSYDSVEIQVLQLPNAMVFDDPNYPEGNLLFPEFEVEIHDSWGRLVKAMDEGLGWDGTRRGKRVEVGTYYYRVKLPTVEGYDYVKGAVTVFTKKK